MAAIGTAERRASDKALITDHGRWPLWPILPVKRPGGESGMELGLITPDYPSTVIHRALFDTDIAAMIVVQLENDGDVPGAKTTRYQDVDALLDDGWTVD